MAPRTDWRSELRHLTELFLIPMVTVLLPWSLGYRWLRLCARARWLMREEWQAALAGAQRWLDISDPADWAWRYRTVRLVDHADLWLGRVRSDRWMARHFSARPALPPPNRRAVGAFFHWCAGMWSVRALRATGTPVAPIARRFHRQAMGGTYFSYLYGKLRFDEFSRAAGRPLLYAPGTMKQALAELSQDHWVIGAPDIYPSDAPFPREVRAFGRRAWFTEGMLRVAREAGAPVFLFTLGVEFDTGRRDLRVAGPFPPDDPQLLQRIATFWEELVRDRSWGFTLWPKMEAYFIRPDHVTAGAEPEGADADPG